MTYGAEYHGLREDFNKSKWTVIDYEDWQEDTQYQKDKPVGGLAYRKDIETYGTRCIHCLWNDGDMCVHEKVEQAKENEEYQNGKIESEAMERMEAESAAIDKYYWEVN